jgi:HTH-type transcriptional regulator, sugar sensing transcriptional regulator
MKADALSEDETVARLQALGLNLYESRAYLALLNARQLTAKGVGRSALIPQSRTYDILESLTRKGFAMTTPASPPAYVPVTPAKVLGPYYDTEKKKIQERAAKADEEAQARLELLRDAYQTLVKDFPAGPSEARVVRDRVWVLQTRENIENSLIGLIKEAKSEVLRITKPPELKSKEPVDPFYIVGMENQRFVFDALKRKVKMRWLSLTKEIPIFSGLDVREPPERRYLDQGQDITEKFLLVDGHSVLLNLHDPMSPAYGYVALAMESRAASSIFLDHFEKMWEKGRPLRDVLPKMKSLVEEVCAKLPEVGFAKTDVSVYRTLASVGAMSTDALANEMMRKKVQTQDTQASCDRLVRSGLIHREASFRLLMVEHPANVKELIANGKLNPSSGARITTRLPRSSTNL